MDGDLKTARKSADASTARPDRQRLIVTLGRGKTGKSTLLWWVAETARKERPLRIIDADPNNQTLCERFPEAVRPTSNSGDDRRMWIEEQIGQMMLAAGGEGEKHDLLLDLGGGDLLMKRLGVELQLAESLEEAGVDVTAVYMIGPSEADLSFLADVEARRLFCPKRTLVIVNAGLVSSERSYEKAFAHVVASPVIRAVTKPDRGGKVVVMPALGCMSLMEERGIKTLSACFSDEGRRALLPLNVMRVRAWLKQMEALRAECGDWLP